MNIRVNATRLRSRWLVLAVAPVLAIGMCIVGIAPRQQVMYVDKHSGRVRTDREWAGWVIASETKDTNFSLLVARLVGNTKDPEWCLVLRKRVWSHNAATTPCGRALSFLSELGDVLTTAVVSESDQRSMVVSALAIVEQPHEGRVFEQIRITNATLELVDARGQIVASCPILH